MNMYKLAKRIKERRLALGISQETLAKKAKVCRASVISIEQGRILPRVDAAFRISRTLEMDLMQMSEDLLGKA